MTSPGSSPTSSAPTTAHRYPPRSNSPRTWCSAPSTTPRPWASTPTATSTSQTPIPATGNHPAKPDPDSTASPPFSKAPPTPPPASYAPSTGRSDPTTTTSQPSPAPTATCDRPQHTAHPASSSSRSIYITFPGWSTSQASLGRLTAAEDPPARGRIGEHRHAPGRCQPGEPEIQAQRGKAGRDADGEQVVEGDDDRVPRELPADRSVRPEVHRTVEHEVQAEGGHVGQRPRDGQRQPGPAA